MITLRAARWPDDYASLTLLDGSYSSDRVFAVESTERSFVLREKTVSPPIQKKFPLPGDIDALQSADWVHVASDGGSIVAMAAMKFERWNRRCTLQHIYVAPTVRRLGIGKRLLHSAQAEAEKMKARCIWAETQTVNYDAVRFYEKMGFTWCGLDSSLYDHENADEIALFFMHPISTSSPRG
jgi:ribosomal protein S18 acetylase RimI-like enzyme